jgi:hypothetical protein
VLCYYYQYYCFLTGGGGGGGGSGGGGANCLRFPVTIKSSNTHMYLHKRRFGLEDKARIN